MKLAMEISFALFMILTFGCTGNHLISNKEYLAVVEKLFDERKQLASNWEVALFSVFNRKLSVKQTEALKFHFAFMPLCDLADYDGDYFLANI